MLWLGYLATIVLAYLVGSIPIGLVLTKRMKGIDIRERGSGKTGATNVFRALGWRAGLATLVGDALKGVVAVVIARTLLSSFGFDAVQYGEIAGAMASIAGHNWPINTGFRGGRGVATALGAGMTLSPLAAAITVPLAVGIIVVSDMASAGSLGGALLWLAVFAVLIASGNETSLHGLFAAVAAAFLFFQHRDNIGRLVRGEERKLDLRRRLRGQVTDVSRGTSAK